MEKAIRYLVYFIIVFGVMSCTTQKKVLNYMHKNQDFKLKYLAENCEVKEVEKYIKGKDSIIEKTVEVKGDSIPCPPNEKGEIVKVKCPDAKVKYKERLRVDTVVKTVELKDKQIYIQKERDKEKDRADKAEDKANKLRHWLIALICIFGISIYLKLKGIL